MPPFEQLVNLVNEKLHEQTGFSEEDKRYVDAIIENSVNFVVGRLYEKYRDDEDKLKSVVKSIAANVGIFTAIIIVQLEFFSMEKDEGPFFDMLRKMMEDETENNNNSGYSSS